MHPIFTPTQPLPVRYSILYTCTHTVCVSYMSATTSARSQSPHSRLPSHALRQAAPTGATRTHPCKTLRIVLKHMVFLILLWSGGQPHASLPVYGTARMMSGIPYDIVGEMVGHLRLLRREAHPREKCNRLAYTHASPVRYTLYPTGRCGYTLSGPQLEPAPAQASARNVLENAVPGNVG
jgi:hypothetical protein